jgi:hypothetical protein
LQASIIILFCKSIDVVCNSTEIIGDVSVEMIPLHYRWGCRTFQTASHIHVIHILGVWTP